LEWACTKLDPPKHAFINPVVTAAATMYQEPVAFSYSLQAPWTASRWEQVWHWMYAGRESLSLIRRDWPLSASCYLTKLILDCSLGIWPTVYSRRFTTTDICLHNYNVQGRW